MSFICVVRLIGKMQTSQFVIQYICVSLLIMNIALLHPLNAINVAEKKVPDHH